MGITNLHQTNDFLQRPRMIGNTRPHRRGNSQGLVDTSKVVVHEVKCNRRSVILNHF